MACAAWRRRSTPELRARAAGLPVESFDALDALDLVIDGADQVAPDGWVVKGGGGAHLREKVVAAASARFVVIVDATKVVAALHEPIPVELLAFGLQATLHHLQPVALRDAATSPDHGIIADFHGTVGDPAELAAWLSAVPGVVEHGLFPASMVDDVLIAGPEGVEHRTLSVSISAPDTATTANPGQMCAQSRCSRSMTASPP